MQLLLLVVFNSLIVFLSRGVTLAINSTDASSFNRFIAPAFSAYFMPFRIPRSSHKLGNSVNSSAFSI